MTKLLHEFRPLTVRLVDNGIYIVTQLECEEVLSQGTSFIFSVVSNNEIGDKVLGKSVDVIFQQEKETRHFFGLAVSIELMGYSEEKSLFFYQIQASDPLSLLAYRYNRQIFQDMTTKQIIDKVLGESDFKSYFKVSLSENGKKHKYCAQLDESDLLFVQRLLSSEGWHYHVDHTGSKAIVIIADSNQGFKSIEKNAVYFQDGSSDPESVVNTWQLKTSIGTAKLSLVDHTQELAEVFSSGERKSEFTHSPTSFSSYHYGQGFTDKGNIRSAVKRHMEALDIEKTLAISQSHIAAFSCGKRFKLLKHPVSRFNQEYVISQVTHSINCDESGRRVVYQNHFQCLITSSPYRPVLRLKPLVHSIHTARVTGPKDKEIYRDNMGRIKVQFHWDQQGKDDENASCWLPVSQGLASKGFGMQFVPRIGDEVLVQYIDGNPDRPIVVGSIYNKSNATPYSSASQSGIKMRTTPKGSSKQGNELRFEDQKDKEHVFIHAEKDFLLDANNDWITTIKGNQTTAIEQNSELLVKEALSLKSEKTIEINSKEKWSSSSDKEVKLNAGSKMLLEAKSSVTVDGSSITITGKSKIELKVGASKIEINASGIKIDAPKVSILGKATVEMKAAMVKVEGQGKVNVKAATVTLNGSAMTQIKAGAMVQVKGAITKVN
ncbi:type VI secretion system Vgr family protein [Aliivibrio salmonicida]|uniref:type VI secretion system Vgr family protein n=1 Tax=Aliivibrio salmonicida TaxID=40269 RepID=UPI003D0E24DD